MQGGTEGRLFLDSAERRDRSIRGKKRGAISDLSPAESKWINPFYRNHRSWLDSMLSCITLERQPLRVCNPSPPHTHNPSHLLCFTLLWIIPDENIICPLSRRLSYTNPNPQKWQLSYTGIMSSSPPKSHLQPKKINYKGVGLAPLLPHTWAIDWWRKTSEGRQRGAEGEEQITLSKLSVMTAEQDTKTLIFSPTMNRGSLFQPFFSLDLIAFNRFQLTLTHCYIHLQEG